MWVFYNILSDTFYSAANQNKEDKNNVASQMYL